MVVVVVVVVVNRTNHDENLFRFCYWVGEPAAHTQLRHLARRQRTLDIADRPVVSAWSNGKHAHRFHNDSSARKPCSLRTRPKSCVGVDPDVVPGCTCVDTAENAPRDDTARCRGSRSTRPEAWGRPRTTRGLESRCCPRGSFLVKRHCRD